MGQQDELRRVADEIGALRDLDVAALDRRWRLLTGRHLSTPLPRPILVRLLAYRIQSDAFGDIAAAAARALNRIAKQQASGDVRDEKPTLESLGLSSRGDRVLSPGAVLVREHDGVHHRRPFRH